MCVRTRAEICLYDMYMHLYMCPCMLYARVWHVCVFLYVHLWVCLCVSVGTRVKLRAQHSFLVLFSTFFGTEVSSRSLLRMPGWLACTFSCQVMGALRCHSLSVGSWESGLRSKRWQMLIDRLSSKLTLSTWMVLISLSSSVPWSARVDALHFQLHWSQYLGTPGLASTRRPPQWFHRSSEPLISGWEQESSYAGKEAHFVEQHGAPRVLHFWSLPQVWRNFYWNTGGVNLGLYRGQGHIILLPGKGLLMYSSIHGVGQPFFLPEGI